MPSARTTTCGGRGGAKEGGRPRQRRRAEEGPAGTKSSLEWRSVQTLKRFAPWRDAARRRAARTRGGSRTYHVLALKELLRDDRREAAEEVTAAIDANHLLGTRRDESAAFSVSGTRERKDASAERAEGAGRDVPTLVRGVSTLEEADTRARITARAWARRHDRRARREPPAPGPVRPGFHRLERWRWRAARQGFGRELGASRVRDAREGTPSSASADGGRTVLSIVTCLRDACRRAV